MSLALLWCHCCKGKQHCETSCDLKCCLMVFGTRKAFGKRGWYSVMEKHNFDTTWSGEMRDRRPSIFPLSAKSFCHYKHSHPHRHRYCVCLLPIKYNLNNFKVELKIVIPVSWVTMPYKLSGGCWCFGGAVELEAVCSFETFVPTHLPVCSESERKTITRKQCLILEENILDRSINYFSRHC
jgi:hypothetical protein